ncbi:MAG TPA: DUF6089 family protein [Bacteroidia bacterium]|jgi:hypothetical protein|nr:DUF6089 family protein [Bacteroidia bacterium]
MKRILLLSAILSLPFISEAQYKWDIGVKLGAANYLGDIGGGITTRRNFVPDMKMGETRFAGGGFARLKVHPKASVQFGLEYGHIMGDDKLSANPARHDRNLNFKNNIFEANVMGQFFFYEINDLGHTYRYRNDFRAYIGLGVAGFHHNPKTLDGGIPLQPLMTEGVDYSLFQIAIPAQLGCYFTIDKKYRIGWDITWRTTFTDYLDDVSGHYVNPATLTPQAAALADRTNELNVSQAVKNQYGWYEGKGNKRGDPTHKDSYIFSTINVSYALRGKSSFYRSNYGSLFKGKKYKKRKFRAKF